jgi:hypothetical protein
MYLTTWLDLLGRLITAGGLYLTWWGLRNLYYTKRAEVAVNAVQSWVEFVGSRPPVARYLAAALDRLQLTALYERVPFKIDAKHKDLLCLALSESGTHCDLTEADGLIHLRLDHVVILRWQLINYLNHLESALTPRRHGITSERIMVEEFRYLVRTKQGDSVLDTFREIADTRDYPAIYRFVRRLSELPEPPKVPSVEPIGPPPFVRD